MHNENSDESTSAGGETTPSASDNAQSEAKSPPSDHVEIQLRLPEDVINLARRAGYAAGRAMEQALSVLTHVALQRELAVDREQAPTYPDVSALREALNASSAPQGGGVEEAMERAAEEIEQSGHPYITTVGASRIIRKHMAALTAQPRTDASTQVAVKDDASFTATDAAQQGWIAAVDRELVNAHLGVANADDDVDTARRKLATLIDWHVAVATDPAVNGGFKLVPVTAPPSAPAPVAGDAVANEWRDLVQSLVDHIVGETCLHENTQRGGAIWEICDDCGAQWADDRGGRPDFQWPEIVERANAALSQDRASQTVAPIAPVGVSKEVEAKLIDIAAGVLNDNNGKIGKRKFRADAAAVVRRVLRALAQQPAARVGCEGKPAPENSPCAVCGQQPAAVGDTRRLEWLIANELLVHRLSDTGLWMVTTGDLSPAIDGGEYDTPREAIDAGLAALSQQPGEEGWTTTR